MLDIDQLRAFTQVAREGSFSRAADQLFITQPAVSKRIAGLETELDSRLFDRIGHRIVLTEAGRELLPRAQRILQEVEDSRRALSNLAGTVGGALRIGTSHHIGLHRLPPVLRRFTQDFPDVTLDIAFMDSEEACQAVLHGELELGIVTLPLDPDPALHTETVWDDPLGVAVGRDHPLARGRKQPRRCSLAQLARHPAILPATGTFTRELINRRLAPLNLQVKIGMSTNYLETIKMLVSVGLGWSVLPKSMLGDDLVAIRVRELELQRTLGVVRHVERTLSNAGRSLLQLLQEYHRG